MNMINSKPTTTDRYVSFAGIDCDARNTTLIKRIWQHTENPEWNNAFWDKFRAETTQAMEAGDVSERKFDGLCIVCARIAIIKELLEDIEDEDGLALAEAIEYECC